MRSMSGAVFLSYASQDAVVARRLSEALTSAGIEVWFDQSELRGGDAWDQKIRRQIKECSLFVPVISASTDGRSEGYFRREWRLAVERTHDMADHVTFLLPLAVGGLDEKQAHVPEAFRDVQWMRMRPDGSPPETFADTVNSLLKPASASLAQNSAVPQGIASRVATAQAGADPKSVAVLAFANRSDDRENEYFSDGISEELIHSLAKVPGLKVSARTSAFHFKGQNLPIAEIARQLGVAYVVEGSVRKVGDRVRITAQLIKAADGFNAWSDTFTRDLKDIFAVQDEIARLIASSLALRLGSPSKGTMEPKAYELFLKGRQVMNRSFDDHATAIDYYKASLEIDANSAITWASLSYASLIRYALSGLGDSRIIEVSRQAARRAVELDPNLANGHEALGILQCTIDYDWIGSVASLKRALALAPGDASIISNLSTFAQVLGRTQRALELGRKAVDLDPLNSLIGYTYGKALFKARLFEELERHGERMIETNPSVAYGHVFRVYARLFLGRTREAANAAANIPQGFFRVVCHAHCGYVNSDIAASDAALSQLKSVYGTSGAYQIAEVHAYRGEIDAAFEWLEYAYSARDTGLIWLRDDAFLKPLLEDRRWEAFLHKMKLSEVQIEAVPELKDI
jgi:adenylate cyclase